MGAVRPGMCVEVKQIPEAREPIALHLSSLPGRHFFPLSHCTLNSESVPRGLLEAPGFFFTRCWWVYFNFLFPGLWVIISLFTEDKKQPSCVSVVGTLLLVFPARGGTGLSSLAVWFFLCVFFFSEPAQLPKLSVSHL